MTFTYCPNCGDLLTLKDIGDEGPVPFCADCDAPWFSFSWPCVLCLVVDDRGGVVLTREPNRATYGGVAGYIRQGESAESAARREVKEELGLAVAELRYAKSGIVRDRLMLCFICQVSGTEITVSEELESAGWFPAAEARALLREGSVIRQLLDDYMDRK